MQALITGTLAAAGEDVAAAPEQVGVVAPLGLVSERPPGGRCAVIGRAS